MLSKMRLVVLMFLPLGLAFGQQSVSTSQAETTDLWFVELGNPPLSDGGSVNAVRNDKTQFRARARAAGLNFQERYAYDNLFNGLAVRINPVDRAKLARIEGVKAIFPVEAYAVPEPRRETSPELLTALAMTGADIVQSELGFTGAGVKVGILDSGIDYHHPDLGNCFGPGCRVVTGYDFVGNAYTDSSSTPVPDPDPDDCDGHGTHVAGIVGANGVIKGVAPGVTFGAYKVFGCTGSTGGDIILAAMERALADGMHVLNISIGSSFQWPQYPTAAAATRLVNRGMVVVSSIGNSGGYGLYSASAPGVGQKVIGVASFENTARNAFLPYFTVSPDDKQIGYTVATASPAAPTSGSAPMARTGTPTSTNDACSPLPAGSLTGQVALIRRGTCQFYVKAYNAQNAGAIGVVLYNNVAGRFSPTVSGTPPITIPVVAVSDAEGVLINNRLAAGPVTMTWSNQTAWFSTPATGGGLISSTSSYGLGPDLSLKPDLGAPGGFITSTYPIEQGSYASLSGTSMASPHVAGAAALMLEARPNTPAQAMNSLLQNSAVPKPWWGNPGLGFLDNVHRQGAGMLDIDDAILSTTRIEPGKLDLGESEFGPVTRRLTIQNKAASAITYDLSHSPALATGSDTFVIAFFAAPSTVSFSAPSVLVPANGSATVDVTVSPNAGLPALSLYGGYVVFSPQGGGRTYRVPFAGIAGDYQSKPVITPTEYGFPWLAKQVGSSYVNQPAGATYTMVGTDVPLLLAHLDHQSRRLRITITETATGKSWYRAVEEEYMPRNSMASSFFAFPWDGTTGTATDKKTYSVPNGTYTAKIEVIKALGDPSNPAHVEIWTSPPITIARP